jgi:hypothetical protein
VSTSTVGTVYTTRTVERLLRNYLAIRFTLEGRGQQLSDTYVVKAPVQKRTPKPLGMQNTWPFLDPKHAHEPTDGKAKSRLIEELHVSVLDLERGFQHLADDDLELIYKYHVFQTHTLDDLVAERQVTSRGSMSQRIYRAVQRLTRVLEHLYE